MGIETLKNNQDGWRGIIHGICHIALAIISRQVALKVARLTPIKLHFSIKNEGSETMHVLGNDPATNQDRTLVDIAPQQTAHIAIARDEVFGCYNQNTCGVFGTYDREGAGVYLPTHVEYDVSLLALPIGTSSLVSEELAKA